MTATFTVNGDKVTIKFEYTAPTLKVTDTIGTAAHYLWNAGQGDHGTDETPILFDSLNNAKKLALIDAALKQHIINLAKTYEANAAAEAASLAIVQDKFIT